jgi:hypothetical protein
LDCPTSQPQSQRGVIRETPEEIAELAPLLTGGDLASRIPRVVETLRKRYPDAQSAGLANYRITASCPTVAKTSNPSEGEKTAKVKAFAQQVLQFLY